MSQVAESWLASENGLLLIEKSSKFSTVKPGKRQLRKGTQMDYDKDWISPGALYPLLEFL